MATRILLVITPESAGSAARAARDAAQLARESGGTLRLMYVRPVPPPRMDRCDRMIADSDREMARMATVAEERLRTIAADLGDVAMDSAVRFGRLIDEISTEAEVFDADLIGLASAPRPSVRRQLVAWYLGHVTRGMRARVVLLPLGTTRKTTTRDALAMASLRQI